MAGFVIGKPHPQTEKLLQAIFGPGPAEKGENAWETSDRQAGEEDKTRGAEIEKTS